MLHVINAIKYPDVFQFKCVNLPLTPHVCAGYIHVDIDIVLSYPSALNYFEIFMIIFFIFREIKGKIENTAELKDILGANIYKNFVKKNFLGN